jgi:glucuronoarabinoxylan endo-1,4-beta-xylanase
MYQRTFPVMIALVCIAIIGGSWRASAQTAMVSGTVTASSVAVRNASVTFEETANPSRSYAAVTDSTGHFRISLGLTAADPGTMLPVAFTLAQNYPNPFSSSTTIGYALHRQVDTRVTVFDLLGRIVRETRTGNQSAGLHRMVWDGADASGRKVSPGVYFYRLQAGGESQVGKMIMDGSGSFSQQHAIQGLPVAVDGGTAVRSTPAAMSFTLRIGNTPTTAPLISAAQLNNVIVAGDTSITLQVAALPPPPVVTVFADSLLQVIRGFGGANILPWRPAMTAGQMATAFGAGPGQLGFTILRLRIPFTTDLNEFSDQAAVSQLAQSAGAQIIFASPWTPPPAMKTNNNIVAGSLSDTAYASYAAHLKGFADFMAGQGVPLYAISLQNEPDARVTYESCDWTPVQFRTFLKNNAASIGYRIMMPESQNFVRALSDSSLNDPDAAAKIQIVGGHIYGGGLSPYPLAVNKGKEIWMTEHLELDTSWTAVLGTGREIHDCLNAGWNAYIWWYIVRYYGPVGEDGVVTKRGYVMSQFARFIRPGYRKVACNPTPQRNVVVSAYKDPATAKVVLVVINTGASAVYQTFTIPTGSPTGCEVYTTTKTKNCERGVDVPAVQGSFTYLLEPSSITTFIAK